jgi:hypothetical protein
LLTAVHLSTQTEHSPQFPDHCQTSGSLLEQMLADYGTLSASEWREQFPHVWACSDILDMNKVQSSKLQQQNTRNNCILQRCQKVVKNATYFQSIYSMYLFQSPLEAGKFTKS